MSAKAQEHFRSGTASPLNPAATASKTRTISEPPFPPATAAAAGSIPRGTAARLRLYLTQPSLFPPPTTTPTGRRRPTYPRVHDSTVPERDWWIRTRIAMRMRVWVRVVYPDEDSRFGDRQDGEKAGAARRVSTSAGANPRSRWTGNLDSHRLVENGERHASAFVFAPAASRGRVCENEVAQGSASVLGPEQAGSMCPFHPCLRLWRYRRALSGECATERVVDRRRHGERARWRTRGALRAAARGMWICKFLAQPHTTERLQCAANGEHVSLGKPPRPSRTRSRRVGRLKITRRRSGGDASGSASPIMRRSLPRPTRDDITRASAERGVQKRSRLWRRHPEDDGGRGDGGHGVDERVAESTEENDGVHALQNGIASRRAGEAAHVTSSAGDDCGANGPYVGASGVISRTKALGHTRSAHVRTPLSPSKTPPTHYPLLPSLARTHRCRSCHTSCRDRVEARDVRLNLGASPRLAAGRLEVGAGIAYCMMRMWVRARRSEGGDEGDEDIDSVEEGARQTRVTSRRGAASVPTTGWRRRRVKWRRPGGD
ncbi:hypothetical protein B0H13DRAFT_2292243 [Mycena leptocephala]|nr:hypothetical protein B0H13DRAFT_2292243 [Mycena leptocephala]